MVQLHLRFGTVGDVGDKQTDRRPNWQLVRLLSLLRVSVSV